MSAPAVEVQRLSKRFRRGERHDSLRDLVPAAIRRLSGRGRKEDELQAGEFWAVRDVSFAVQPGEALGIIGPNGAGKSTILKLLTRVLRPTLGRCAVRGRFGALIEVAAGFHPDLTGRENIFLQGAIMGMRRAEIANRLDRIVDFAGISPFIDTPVKRYSSGMNARLGFAIAAHLDPDVLVIDEVIAVGDFAFQQKCLERMKMYRDDGAAIVFVSHNMQAVNELCGRTLFLDSSVRAEGPTPEVLREFIRSMNGREERSTGDAMHITATRLLDAHGVPVDRAQAGDRLRFELDVVSRETVEAALFRMVLFRSTDGLRAYDGHTQASDAGKPLIEAGERFTVRFDFRAHLSHGHYFFEGAVQHAPTARVLARLNPAAALAVINESGSGGVADLEMECRA